MRFCIVKNFVRRSVFYKFNKYLALTGVFSACGKFAVRKAPAPPSPNCTLLVVSRIPLPVSKSNPAGLVGLHRADRTFEFFNSIFIFFCDFGIFKFLHIFSLRLQKVLRQRLQEKNILSFFLASIERLKIVQLLKNFLSTLISFAALFKTVSLV